MGAAMRFERVENLLQLALQMQTSYMGVSIEEIQEEFTVSRRTAERMRDAVMRVFPGVEEIRCEDPRRKRWRLSRSSGPKPSDVSVDDFSSLQAAKKHLTKAGLKQHASRIRNLETKLRSNIDDRKLTSIDVDLEALLEAEGIAMRPGPRPIVKDGVISEIRTAILKCEKIRIQYVSLGTNKTSVRKLCPYGCLYGNRHYLVALGSSSKEGEYKLFSLSNIKSVKLLGEPFERKEFSLEAYAEKSFGVFQGNIHEVVLEFSKKVAEGAKRYQFHPTQRITEQKRGSIRVEITASSLRELAWHLFTWGSEVKVIEPARLRNMMTPIRDTILNTPEWLLEDE